MNNISRDLEKDLRDSFEESLQRRIQRASRVQFLPIQPSHWFSAASADCVGMYVSGFFYGAISIAQAYIEALSKFLAERHDVKLGNNVERRFERLRNNDVISSAARDAAIAIYKERNDYHHLNKDVPQEHAILEARAGNCVNSIYVIESELFASTFDNGKIVPKNPDYLPFTSSDTVGVFLRKL